MTSGTCGYCHSPALVEATVIGGMPATACKPCKATYDGASDNVVYAGLHYRIKEVAKYIPGSHLHHGQHHADCHGCQIYRHLMAAAHVAQTARQRPPLPV